MSKKVVAYRAFLYILMLAVIIGGGLLFAYTKLGKLSSESTQSVVDADYLYDSTVTNIYPDSGEISIWDGTSSEAPQGLGDEYEPYLIASAANLNYFRANAASFNNKYIKQTINIDLAGHAWDPITTGTYKYDGNGKTIYNLCINSVSSRHVGLFSYLNSGSYLKNLNIVGATIVVDNSSNIAYSGTFVGYCSGSSSTRNTLSNLHATQVTISVKAGSAVGGIVGNTVSTNFDNLSFDGNIYAEGSRSIGVGGVIGDISGGVMTVTNLSSFGNIFVKAQDGTTQRADVGGIVGFMYSSQNWGVVENLVNYSNIQVSYPIMCAGGIFGYIGGADQTTCIAKYLVNYGNLFGEWMVTSDASYGYVAGICGMCDNLTLFSSANYGNIYFKNENTGSISFNVGGIYGYGDTLGISYCYNQGNILGQLASSVTARIGGITGYAYSDTSINEVLSVGSVARYYNNTGLGGVFGRIETSTITLDGAYFTSDTVTNAYWENAVVLSDTSKIAGYWGSGFSAVNYGAVTSSNIKPTSPNVKPTALSSFDETYWDFSRVGEYPRPKNIPVATRLVANTKNIKLELNAASDIYDGTAKEKDLTVCTYELKGFENTDPTSYWDGITTTIPNGKGTKAEPYLIESAANLAWVSANTQTDNGEAWNKYYVQTVNIDLNNKQWTPIGGISSYMTYGMFYDGNCHTIKNLSVTQTSSNYSGLFGAISFGYIKNLGIESGKIATNTSVVGGILGYLCGSEYENVSCVKNCYNKATIYSSCTSTASRVGGVVGSSFDFGIIENCWNAGNIYVYGKAKSVGGICSGCEWDGYAKNCVNTGNIILSGKVGVTTGTYVGGILGAGTCNGCINYGDITTTGEAAIKTFYIGGICGVCYYDQSSYVGYNLNLGSLAGLAGYSSIVAGICSSYSTDGNETAMDVLSYYNQEMCGFNVVGGFVSNLTNFNVTNVTACTTANLICTTEETKPAALPSGLEYNYFKGQYPSVKAVYGSMTFYQKIVDENSTKPEISSWSGDYDLSVAPTLLNPSAANSESNPYIIDSANKLAYLSKYYSASTVSGCYFKQTVDIDLCGHNWTPINDACNSSYSLYYDGNNHTIYNLKIEQTGISQTKQIGFIGFLATGYIKNLTLNGGIVRVVGEYSNTQHIGAFVGQVRSPTIENCHNIGVDVICDQLGCGRVGGIVGEGALGAQILNCSNSGRVDVKYVTNASYGAAVAGICGCFYAQTSEGNVGNITNCINYGYISCVSTVGSQVGGIVGYTHLGRINITSCENYGDCYCNSGSECRVGGIAGYVATVGGQSKTVVVTKCFNSGNIRGAETASTPNVGGIVGFLEGVTSTEPNIVSQSVSVGSIATIPGQSVTYLGGIVGAILGDYHTVTNCYYNYQTVASGKWEDSTTYLSTAADSQYLYGYRADSGSTLNISNSEPRLTAAMQSTANGVAPTGINHITDNDANYSLVKGQYPHARSLAEQNYSYDNTSTFMASSQNKSVVSVWRGGAMAPTLKYTNVPNSESNPYIIDDANKLAWISNNAATANGYYFEQTVDIDLNNRAWTPINCTTNAYVYHYDGDNHTIYNINVNSSATNLNVGLFGLMGEGSVIQNLTINGGQVIGTSTANVSGGAFVGRITYLAASEQTIIKNCHNVNVSVMLKGGTSSTGNAGGIVGVLYGATMENCSNSGVVSVACDTVNGYAGGMIGQSFYDLQLMNCVNYGNISSVGSNGRSGGMIGRIVNTEGYNVVVNYCVNYAKVMALSSTGGGCQSGGIVGDQIGQAVIMYCVNYGEILGYEGPGHAPSAGGIIGRASEQTEALTFLMAYCYSVGQVGSIYTTTITRCGGIIGECGTNYDYITIMNCYYNYETVASGTTADVRYLTSRNNLADLYGLAPSNVSQTIVNCAPLTTAQMQGLTTSMAGFDEGVWEFSANNYPKLKSQAKSVWDGTSSVKPTGAGTEANPYIIASAANLAYLSDHYSDSDIVGKYFKQVVDIDLANHEWTPINSSSIYNYAYSYDGNNHTIYNLYVNNVTSGSLHAYGGLFGAVNGGYIKNLTINGGSVTAINTTDRVALAGAIVAFYYGLNAFTIENCHNVGVSIYTSKPQNATGNHSWAGGIAGAVRGGGGRIVNCSNTGTIISENNGSIISENNYTYHSYAGGIVALLDAISGSSAGNISGCVNYGSVSAKALSNCGLAGGIAGFYSNDSTTVSKISECANYGSIYGCDQNGTNGFAGGIVGWGRYFITLANCFNSGQVLSEETSQNGSYSAGIIGGIDLATATNKASVSYCLSVGPVGIHYSGGLGLGGITGWHGDANFTVSSCYYDYQKTNTGTGDGNYWLDATNTANNLHGTDIYNTNFTNCAPLATVQMTVTTDGAAPSGFRGWSSTYWDFIAGCYPQLRNMPSNSSPGISYWDGTSSEAPVNGDGSANNPYIIDSASKLAWISDQSNNSSTRANINGKYFIQTADINLNNLAWTPICNYTSGVARTEIKYDGQNHTIYNLNTTVNASGNQFGGLFGQLCYSSYIKNLNLENVYASATSTDGNAYTGAFLGAALGESGEILLQNLHAKNVNLTSSSNGNPNFIGGVVGWIMRARVVACSTDGTFEYNTTNTARESQIGGVVGNARNISYIENCSNSCDIIKYDVNWTGNVEIGGILGGTNSTVLISITNCVNYGSIQFSRSTTGDIHIAGIAGWSGGTAISGCSNYGYLYGLGAGSRSYVGGIGGRGSTTTVINCANYGDLFADITGQNSQAGGIIANTDLNVTISYCYNAGHILAKGGTNTLHAGGIAGGFDEVSNTMTNCYSVGSVGIIQTGTVTYAGCVGLCYVIRTGTTLTNCYYNKDTAASGNWAEKGITGITYLSTTDNNPYGTYTTPTATNVSGLTTAQMQSVSNGTRPTGMVGFTQENWNFVQGNYPSLGLLAYDVLYSNNTNAGTATASVALGKGSGYIGVLSQNFTISKATNAWALSPSMVNYSYNDDVSPLIALARFGDYTAVFKNSSGTTVTMSSTSNAGDYTVVVSVAGTDNYTALQTTITFTVTPCDITDNPNINIIMDEEIVYDGNVQTPDPTVTYG